MEELVGKIWHRWITASAEQRHPEAAVALDDIQRSVGIFFRALGGEGGLRIERSTDAQVNARRTLLQRIAGTGKTVQYAWRDEETLRLPEEIALFPERSLNRKLYLWLAALSVAPDEGGDWISRNQFRTRATLAAWPGLEKIYRQLLAAHLRQRPLPENLPDDEARQERAIRAALENPETPVTLQYARRPPQPVPLWLHPSPPPLEEPVENPSPDDEAESPEPNPSRSTRQQHKRKRAEYTDMPDGKNGLLSFRLESLWSWAEYIKVDRTTTEDDDDDAGKTAEDMDKITLARDNQTTASRIRLDLDLPASQYDDIVLGEGIPVDEWDYRQQRLQKAHCRLQLMTARHAENTALPDRLRPQARRIHRHFEMLRPQRHWVSRQNDGSEIDMENYIRFFTDRRLGKTGNDAPVYRSLRNQTRDLACLLLADLSLSTDAHINNDARVIDVIRDALHLFSEALDATGDRFALHGFSSRNRNHIRFYNIKTFDDPHDKAARGRINAIKPGYYTRMGAAIRYASQLLE
ncbi:MAG TPA: nitric oxide reductase, partial [Gammaproteobacteria bacterium]|nr:nitric oxide reductase [Gammaproteobacteria bacterium]